VLAYPQGKFCFLAADGPEASHFQEEISLICCIVARKEEEPKMLCNMVEPEWVLRDEIPRLSVVSRPADRNSVPMFLELAFNYV